MVGHVESALIIDKPLYLRVATTKALRVVTCRDPLPQDSLVMVGGLGMMPKKNTSNRTPELVSNGQYVRQHLENPIG
jgi:hypothetical protein